MNTIIVQPHFIDKINLIQNQSATDHNTLMQKRESTVKKYQNMMDLSMAGNDGTVTIPMTQQVGGNATFQSMIDTAKCVIGVDLQAMKLFDPKTGKQISKIYGEMIALNPNMTYRPALKVAKLLSGVGKIVNMYTKQNGIDTDKYIVSIPNMYMIGIRNEDWMKWSKLITKEQLDAALKVEIKANDEVRNVVVPEWQLRDAKATNTILETKLADRALFADYFGSLKIWSWGAVYYIADRAEGLTDFYRTAADGAGLFNYLTSQETQKTN